jgi:cell wall-associated NlpC family hydrolase
MAIVIVVSFIIYKRAMNTHTSEVTTSAISEMLECLREHIGTPHSSKSSNGLDCSALVRKCYRLADIQLPRDSRSQFLVGEKISTNNAKPGDLIFFLGSHLNSNQVGHSGVITDVSSKQISFIHSTLSKGVTESQLSEPYYQKRFKGIRRVLND